MKKSNILLIAIISIIFGACSFDNYDEPNSMLEGKIVYQGEPIYVGFNQVTFQLWEPGWQTDIPIDVTVAPDGSFSALLFNGTYKLIIPAWQGPFRSITNTETQSDTILVNLNGNTEMDIEVEPYYMVRNTNISLSGSNITASFSLDKVITGDGGRDIERVYLYVNKTQFVDLQSNIGRSDLPGSEIENLNSISLSTPVPELIVDQDYLFARVGVKISNVEDLIFSAVQKINL